MKTFFPPIRVLIIDDEPAMRDVLKRGLVPLGFEVEIAESGEQGLELAKRQSPDVVVCDITMPGTDGVEVLRRLKERHATTEVIMLTSYPSLDTARTCLKQGAFDYLTKPVDLPQLQAMICRARARGRLRAYSAEEYRRMKADFVSTVSHELRTPLVSVIGHITMLLKGVYGVPSQDQRRALERADAGAQRLLELVNGIVDFSKLEEHTLTHCPVACRLDEMIRELAQGIEPAATAKGLKVVVEIPPGLLVFADSAKLREMLGCLVSNAIKFTHEGAITIKAAELPDGERIELSVADTGIGMEAADIPLIFEEFRQLDSSVTRQYSGAGLGLALCRRLAELMHGTIEVRSAPQQGSCFTIQLPTGRLNDRGKGEAA